MKRIAWFLSLCLLLVIAGKIYTKTGDKQKRGGAKNRSIAVECAPITKNNLQNLRNFTGTLRPFRQFDISPKVSGRLIKLTVELGAPVHSSHLLAELDNDEYLIAVKEREAELAVVQAQLKSRDARVKLLTAEHKRTEHLFSKKMASESELLEASMDLESAIAEREVNLAQEKQKLAGLEAAQMRLGYCTLNAPDDIDDDSYYVGVRHVDPGTLLRANEPVLTLVSIDRLKARITVIEKDYEKLHIDMQATLTTNAIPDREFPCHIVHISPIIEESSRQALVELEVPNYEYRLKPGMFIRVKLILDEHDNATTVPLEAICERNGKEGVFLVSTQSSESDEAVFTPITTGIRTYQQAEVLSPLNLTGEVVILGHHLLGEKGGSIIRAGSKNLESKKSDSPKGKTKGRGGK